MERVDGCARGRGSVGKQLIRIDGESRIEIGEHDVMLIGVPFGTADGWIRQTKALAPGVRYVPGLEGVWLLRQGDPVPEVPPEAG